jgi:hypothetical protein
MTIPSQIDLPDPDGSFTPQQVSYLHELTYRLEEAYERVAISTNGTYLYANPDSTTTIQQGVWTPEVFGVSTAGAGTYDHQVGYTVRKGIVVDVFFDIQWSAHTGSGNMYVELPYKVRKADNMPFVSPAQTSNYTLGSIDYAVFNAIPDTYRLELWSVTTAAATANIALDTAARVIGSITYIGQEDEGS